MTTSPLPRAEESPDGAGPDVSNQRKDYRDVANGRESLQEKRVNAQRAHDAKTRRTAGPVPFPQHAVHQEAPISIRAHIMPQSRYGQLCASALLPSRGLRCALAAPQRTGSHWRGDACLQQRRQAVAAMAPNVEGGGEDQRPEARDTDTENQARHIHDVKMVAREHCCTRSARNQLRVIGAGNLDISTRALAMRCLAIG